MTDGYGVSPKVKFLDGQPCTQCTGCFKWLPVGSYRKMGKYLANAISLMDTRKFKQKRSPKCQACEAREK